jgi:hypothetical protein
MDKFEFGGKIGIPGYAYTSVESEEDAAYQGLLFIEKNFMTKVVDYNYNQRKKATKKMNTLISMLTQTLELADSLKMMFGELINAIELKRWQFIVDPSSYFSGPMAAGQIDAYLFNANSLKEVDEYAVSCYVACAPHFESLNNLSWKLTVIQNDVALN